ncbi:MAG: division/cell wall cluster transcriptional repressor MraZ [Planctomycetes bacterium]|nr:division/cell wall cluster transcriptional repressor MraZ [Planctomycetota bacterium]
MLTPPRTNRLSPKNQVTLPRDAASLAGNPVQVRALPSWMPGKTAPADRSPVLLLLTEPELRRRERRIIDDQVLSAFDKQRLVLQLNAGAEWLAIDEQRRVVLPQAMVEYLHLDRDVFFVTTGDLIYVWNPDEFRRWSDAPEPVGAPDLSQFILV